jgi:hypothetical protein
MNGPMTCEHCGARAPETAGNIELDGWLRLDAWTNRTVLGIDGVAASVGPNISLRRCLTGDSSKPRRARTPAEAGLRTCRVRRGYPAAAAGDGEPSAEDLATSAVANWRSGPTWETWISTV